MTLKTGSHDDVVKMFNAFRKDVRDTLHGVVQLVYFMRGSISYESMMQMTFAERQLVSEFISERLEQESKRMNPVY